jgi:flagellar motor switch protein FliG
MTEDRALTPLPRRAARTEPAEPDPEPRRLSGRAKAAIVVRLLLNEGTDLPLEDLPEDLQERLTQQMGRMGVIDRATLAAVIGEFAQALDGIGLTFPGGIAGALSALDGRLSPTTAARLRKEYGMRAAGDPWARLRSLPAAELAAMALAESTEVAAVMLSKLETDKAAELLGHLPGPDARRIAFAVSQTETVSPQTVDTIGRALAGLLDRRPERAFDAGPGQRVGEILNQSTAATRDDLLTALDETDAEFASSVRRALFTFGHIPDRIAPRDVARIVRAADPADMVTALAAATGAEDAAAAGFLLSNMSSRLADNLREEIRDRGEVRPRDGEAAMTAIIATIRQLEQQGEITLNPIEDHDD